MIRLSSTIWLTLVATIFCVSESHADSNADQVQRLIASLDDANVRIGASIALTKLGRPVVSELIKSLNSKSSDIRVWSAYTLGEIGPAAKSAVDELSRSCVHDDDALRAASVETLGKIGSSSKIAVDTLTNALTDKNERVCKRSAVALGQLGPKASDATENLIAALSNSHVRDTARDALIRIGPVAADRLLKHLDHDKTRFDIAKVLRTIDSRKAEQAGLNRPTDADLRSLRIVLFDATRTQGDLAEAATALASLKDDGFRVLINAFGNAKIARTAASAFSTTGSDAVPLLIETLTHKQPEVRIFAADAIGSIGPEAWQACAELVKLLTDENRDVRYHAVRTLHSLGQKSVPAVPALIEVIVNPAELEATRQWGIKTLIATLPDTHDAVVKGLIQASKEKRNYGVSQLAKQQLRKIDPKAAEAAGIK